MRPASRATSTNTTEEAVVGFAIDGFEMGGFETGDASSSVEPFHFQSGIVSASKSVLPRTTRDEPRKRHLRRFIAYDRRERSSPRWKFASESIRLSRARLHFSSSARYLWKVARHNSCALLDGDDPVDRHIRQSTHMPARPSDFQRLDLGSFPQTKMNPRIIRRHIAHSALGLLNVCDSLGGQLQRRAEPIAVGACTDQQNFQPVIGVPAIVAQKLRIIAAIVDGDVDVTVIVEISGGQAAADDGAHEIRTQRV